VFICVCFAVTNEAVAKAVGDGANTVKQVAAARPTWLFRHRRALN